jgi:hypothetical protein
MLKTLVVLVLLVALIGGLVDITATIRIYLADRDTPS